MVLDEWRGHEEPIPIRFAREPDSVAWCWGDRSEMSCVRVWCAERPARHRGRRCRTRWGAPKWRLPPQRRARNTRRGCLRHRSRTRQLGPTMTGHSRGCRLDRACSPLGASYPVEEGLRLRLWQEADDVTFPSDRFDGCGALSILRSTTLFHPDPKGRCFFLGLRGCLFRGLNSSTTRHTMSASPFASRDVFLASGSLAFNAFVSRQSITFPRRKRLSWPPLPEPRA